MSFSDGYKAPKNLEQVNKDIDLLRNKNADAHKSVKGKTKDLPPFRCASIEFTFFNDQDQYRVLYVPSTNTWGVFESDGEMPVYSQRATVNPAVDPYHAAEVLYDYLRNN